MRKKETESREKIPTYDRLTVGDRIRKRRLQMGLSQEELAERIGRVAKYCADIERGSCGMSVETLMAFSRILDLSLDYIIWGNETNTNEPFNSTNSDMEDVISISNRLISCSPQKRKYALEILNAYFKAFHIDDL